MAFGALGSPWVQAGHYSCTVGVVSLVLSFLLRQLGQAHTELCAMQAVVRPPVGAALCRIKGALTEQQQQQHMRCFWTTCDGLSVLLVVVAVIVSC